MSRPKIREFKILSIICAVLFVCTVAVYLYKPQVSQPRQTAKTFAVTDIPVSEVSALVVSNEQSVYALIPDGENIRLTSETAKLDYSQSELRAAVYALCHLSATREITNLDNLEQFGFKTPAARLSIIGKNKEEQLFALLNQNPADNSYYLFSENTQKIYLIPEFTAAFLLKTESGYLDKKLFFTNGTETPELIQVEYSPSFKPRGEPLSAYEVAQKNNAFSLIKPLRQKLNAAFVYSELVLPLLTLQAAEVTAVNANITDYGLDNPDFTVNLLFNGKKQSVSFSRQPAFYFAARKAENTVFKIGREDLLFLEDGYPALFDGTAFYVEMGSARRLSVSFNGDIYMLDITGSGTAMSAAYREKTIDFDRLYALFETINGAKIVSEISPEERKKTTARFAAPDIILEVLYDNGTRDLIEITASQNTLCAVRFNGETNFMIPAALVENIKDVFRRL